MNFNEIKEKVTALSTPAISDALDFLKLPGGLLHIKPLDSQQRKCFGRAFTVQYGEGANNKIIKAGNYIDRVASDQVIVVNNNAKVDRTVWGNILTEVACYKGVQGTVINGVCRDVDAIRELGYPIFSLGAYMVTGKGRGHLKETNVPVEISGVTISPNDYIFGDSNGVVVIPAKRIAEVIAIAEEIEAMEQKIIDAVKLNIKLTDARKQFNYNKYGKRQ